MEPRLAIEVILSEPAGTSDKEPPQQQLAALFRTLGVEAHISVAHSGREIGELARRAALGDADIVVAGGGDGTVNAITSQIVDTGKTLGVLPLGTLNHFAKDLDVPLDLEGAVQTIVSGVTARVDVGEVNGHTFVNNSSLGIYPSIVWEREKQQKQGSGKWLAFIWAAISVLRRYPFVDVTLSIDGREFSRRSPFVFVGNNEYEMESFHLGARACLDRGELSLYVTNRTGRLGLVRIALRALFGGLRRERDFTAMCTKEIWIKSRRERLRVAFDGEVELMETPLHYRVRPRALRVRVPPKKEPAG
jgi:diacylglycerol kinase family enzyme